MAPEPQFLATAVATALEAGRIQRRYFRQQPEIQKKGRIDLVTAADLEVERMFRERITERFPEHVVLGEETADTGRTSSSGHRWIIDPVDGTTNFAHGLAIFCVSIALEIDGRVDLGVVYDPMADELFTAERGGGARLNGEPLQVSTTTTLVDALLVTGFPYSVREDPRHHVDLFGSFLREAQAVRRLGSAALDLCYVAAGRLDGYWEGKLHPWDMAAGALILTEAGGTVSDYDNRALDIFGGKLVASNGALHAAMLATIGARLPVDPTD
ncbi:MAG: inositol monophosphatase family protein [Acidobacteriota bacterium]